MYLLKGSIFIVVLMPLQMIFAQGLDQALAQDLDQALAQDLYSFELYRPAENSNVLACKVKPGLPESLKSGFKKEIGQTSYGILSANNSMTSLNQKANQELSSMKNQNTPSLCSEGCYPFGEPVIDIFTQPTGNKANSSCPVSYETLRLNESEVATMNDSAQESISQTEYGIKKVFSLYGEQNDCDMAASQWAKQVLTGGNKLGKFLSNEKCPGVCSFASNIHMVRVPNAAGTCATSIEINVMCGPPKSSANWTSVAYVTNVYQCLPR